MSQQPRLDIINYHFCIATLQDKGTCDERLGCFLVVAGHDAPRPTQGPRQLGVRNSTGRIAPVSTRTQAKLAKNMRIFLSLLFPRRSFAVRGSRFLNRNDAGPR